MFCFIFLCLSALCKANLCLSQHRTKLYTVFFCNSCKIPPKTVDVPHQVAFKADTNSAAKLDDISVRNGPCNPPGSCDFESGQCSWINIPKEGGHDWVLANGGFHGPPTDHTTQTPDGTTSHVFNVVSLKWTCHH